MMMIGQFRYPRMFALAMASNAGLEIAGLYVFSFVRISTRPRRASIMDNVVIHWWIFIFVMIKPLTSPISVPNASDPTIASMRLYCAR